MVKPLIFLLSDLNFLLFFNTSSILIPLARQVKIAGARLKTLNSPNNGLKTV